MEKENENFVSMHLTLETQFISMDMTNINKIKPFVQTWIVLYFYSKHKVIVHVPSSLNSINNILNYIKSECEIAESVLKLSKCIENKDALKSNQIEELAAKIRSIPLEN